MDIRTEVREIEKYVKDCAETKAEQLANISKAQGLIATAKIPSPQDEYHLAVLAIVKNRIIRSQAGSK